MGAAAWAAPAGEALRRTAGDNHPFLGVRHPRPRAVEPFRRRLVCNLVYCVRRITSEIYDVASE